jgi:hypothetical protein
VKPPTRPRPIAPTVRVHLRCCCSQCHSSCHCCRFHCCRCCCCRHSPSHKSTRAQPVQVYQGAAQATRTQPESAWAQLKPRGHSPSLQGRSPSHKGSARPSLGGHSPSHKGAAPNCEGTAQATRAQPKSARVQPKPQGLSPPESARAWPKPLLPAHRQNMVERCRHCQPPPPPSCHSARPNVVRTRVHRPPLPLPGHLPSLTHRPCHSHHPPLHPCGCDDVKFLPLPMCALLSPRDGCDLLLGGGGWGSGNIGAVTLTMAVAIGKVVAPRHLSLSSSSQRGGGWRCWQWCQ